MMNMCLAFLPPQDPAARPVPEAFAGGAGIANAGPGAAEDAPLGLALMHATLDLLFCPDLTCGRRKGT